MFHSSNRGRPKSREKEAFVSPPWDGVKNVHYCKLKKKKKMKTFLRLGTLFANFNELAIF